jgi:hypothetical protein
MTPSGQLSDKEKKEWDAMGTGKSPSFPCSLFLLPSKKTADSSDSHRSLLACVACAI